jgi:hypothetical protein
VDASEADQQTCDAMPCDLMRFDRQDSLLYEQHKKMTKLAFFGNGGEQDILFIKQNTWRKAELF